MRNVIGIDVGSTNTDAVLLKEGTIVNWVKLPTTSDIETGVMRALAQVKTDEPIDRVHIGTTTFRNALVERRGIAARLAECGVTQVAVTSVFGTSYPEDELRAAEILKAMNPKLQGTENEDKEYYIAMEGSNGMYLSVGVGQILADLSVDGQHAMEGGNNTSSASGFWSRGGRRLNPRNFFACVQLQFRKRQ